MDIDDEFKGIEPGRCRHRNLSGADYDPSQLDSKQSHSRFDYNEDDGTKLIPVSDAQSFIFQGSNTLNISEDLENPEHN